MCLSENNERGFTLIELLIVLVIAGILAAVAYPSYQEQVRRTRRAEAQAALLQLMQQQERYFSQHNSYIAFSSTSQTADAQRFKWFSGSSPEQSAYEISGTACAGATIENCIVLTANPDSEKTGVRIQDPHCGALSLNSAGEMSARASDCWR